MPGPAGDQISLLINDANASAGAEAFRTARNKTGDEPLDRLVMPI